MRQGDSRTAGFSLVEVLVSLSIFSIAGVAFASSIMTNQGFNRLSSERTGAQFAVEQIVDDLRVQDPTTLPARDGCGAPRHHRHKDLRCVRHVLFAGQLLQQQRNRPHDSLRGTA